MGEPNFREVLSEIEGKIRSNQFQGARETLSKLTLKSIPREFAAGFANCANRLQEFPVALKLLNGLIRGDRRLLGTPSDQEILEYSFVLRKLGAVKEASQLLGELNPEKNPKSLFYQANCLFSKWEYQEAIPVLQEYIDRIKGNEKEIYSRQIAEINLVAAYLHSQQPLEAQKIIKTLQKSLKEANLKLLLGNSYELETQVMIQLKQWSPAEEAISKALNCLPASNTTSGLFAKKWQAILESLKMQRPSPLLEEVRQLSQKLRHWETYREADFYFASTSNDHELFRKLYFGTPYRSYRERIQAYAGDDFQITEEASWNGQVFKTEEREFSLLSAQEKSHELKVGQALHRLLIVLSIDFYKPVNPVAAFSEVFPDEYFSPTSINRVHQLVKRLRTKFSRHEIPLEILTQESHYKLHFSAPYSLRILKDFPPLEKSELEFQKLKTLMGEKVLSAKEIRESLDISIGKAHSFLKWAEKAGYIQATGRGTKTKYQILKS